MSDPTTQHVTMPRRGSATATVDRATDTIEIKIIQEERDLEAERLRLLPLARRITWAIVLLVLAASVLGNIYQFSARQHIALVQTDGWLYSDASQVIYLFHFPGVGGESTVEAVMYISYFDGKHVATDNQKVHVTISNSTLTVIADGSTLAGQGVYQGKTLTLAVGPHDTIPIWATYTFAPATEDDHTAALQRL